MKDVTLVIRIKRSQQEVFDFTTNPRNTPLWIDGITREESDNFPPQIGTGYRNWDKHNNTNEYVVTRYEPYTIFQLDALHQDFKVKYTYTPLSENETELEYYEWSESGQLHSPSTQEILDALKIVMEQKTA